MQPRRSPAFVTTVVDMADENDASGESSRPQAGVKVELDIDDAPFLEEEEAPEEKPADEAAPDPLPAPPPEPKKAEAPGRLAAFFANKKRLYIIAGGLVLLLVTPLLLMVVLSGKKEPEAPPPVEPQRITAPAAPPREDAPAGPAFLYRADGFFVPLKGGEGEPRFLRCDFAVPTDNPQLFAELSAKNIAVRDSIYYYLSNKPLSFLTDQKSRQTLRLDLISVVNEHVSAEKIQDLYIENYLISGG